MTPPPARSDATLPAPSAIPPAEAVEVAEHLRLSVTRLARLLRQQSDTGLSPSQLSALAAVDRNGLLTLGALAEIERVAPPTITKVVAKLEADGLLRREIDAQDRRISRVSLTPVGLTLLSGIRARKDAWLAARIAALTDDQLGRLDAALDVLDVLVTLDPSAGPKPQGSS